MRNRYPNFALFFLAMCVYTFTSLAENLPGTSNNSSSEAYPAKNLSPPPKNNPSFVIITNAKNNVTEVDRKFLSDAFLKKVSRWSNGEAIRPVDRRADSLLRRKFSQAIVNRSVAEVKSYWQQKIFAGYDLPPPELNVDQDIINYVMKNPGAVGYISEDIPVDQLGDIKVLTIK